jgi:hypothetical protein
MFATDFPANLHPQTRAPFGLHNPLSRDQAEKPQYKGYTPGNPFLRFTSQYKPQVVDTNMNPIVDESRVYAGVWGIISFNLYVFGKSPPRPKKGVSLGLQSVMIVADDDALSGGAVAASEAFKSVKITPRFDARSMMAPPGSPPPPPGSIMPPPAAVAPPWGAPPQEDSEAAEMRRLMGGA